MLAQILSVARASREEAPVLILAGGRGTRLGALHPDCPKPLIPCAGRPFIEWVIDHFHGQGFSRFVVSLGHLAHVALEHFEKRPPDGCDIRCIVEPSPLGTGGAIRHAWRSLPGGPSLVVANGDSLIDADLRPVQEMARAPGVDGVLLGARVADAARFGTLRVGADRRLQGFLEKQPGSGVINAGIYLLGPRALAAFSEKTPLSVEKDVFPELLARGFRLLVHATESPLLDIGTPESLSRAEAFLQAHFRR